MTDVSQAHQECQHCGRTFTSRGLSIHVGIYRARARTTPTTEPVPANLEDELRKLPVGPGMGLDRGDVIETVRRTARSKRTNATRGGPVTDYTRHEAHEVDRLTRGRPLTDDEIACYLADHQTALRHATARVGDEIAEQLRDRLAAELQPGLVEAARGLNDAARTLIEQLDRHGVGNLALFEQQVNHLRGHLLSDEFLRAALSGEPR